MNKNNHAFLQHVEGLRGWAILFVIMFHFTIGNEALPKVFVLENGYLGVEIFVCLMGYFCLKSLSQGSEVRLIRFIGGKISRILIPCAAIVLLTSMASIFFLDYSHIRLLGGTGKYALLGLSNVELMLSANDYFAEDSSMNALLHTWYVAVALQLFVLAIILYQIFRKTNKLTTIASLSLLATVSFYLDFFVDKRAIDSLGIHYLLGDLLTSYYSPLPRIWQFLAGALVFILPDICSNRTKAALNLCSIAFIGVAVFTSLLPELALSSAVVIACALAIKYGHVSCLSYVWNNKCVRFIGSISFSIYLVHMPILVFYKGYTMQSPNMVSLVGLLTLSLIVGFIFYRFIENQRFPRALSLIIWLAAMTSSIVLIKSDGLKNYWNREANKLTYATYDGFRYRNDENLLKAYNENSCVVYGGRGAGIVQKLCSDKSTLSQSKITPFLQIGRDDVPPSFVLMGDSHAIMSYPGLDTIAREYNLSGVLMNSLFLPFCDKNYGDSSHSYAINPQKTEDFFTWLSAHNEIKSVVIIFSWYWITNELNTDGEGKKLANPVQENMKSLSDYLRRLKTLNKQAIVFHPYPRFMSNDMLMRARFQHRRNLPNAAVLTSDYIITRENHTKQWEEAVKMLEIFEKEGLCKTIDPAACLFRENNTCYSFKENKINFFDCNHMSADTSIRVAQAIRERLFEFL